MGVQARIATAGFGALLLLILALGVASARLDVDRASASATAARDAPVAAGTAPSEVRTCDDSTREAILAAVTGQLEAFAEDDWAGALGFATDGFQATIGPDDLEAIIRSTYPIVAEASGARLGGCAVAGPAAQAEIEVVGDFGRTQRLGYLLSFEDGAWRIAGAGTVEGGPGSSGPAIDPTI